MVDYSLGQIVISKAGRDKDDFLIILDMNSEFVYLADGKNRKIEKPKVKKKKHIQIVNYIDKTIVEKIRDHQRVSNSDLRRAIEEFSRRDSLGQK